MPCTPLAHVSRAYLRMLAVLLLTSGGLPVGNAGNARHADSPTPAPGVVAPASV